MQSTAPGVEDTTVSANESLARRVREALAPMGRVEEKRLFGGLAVARAAALDRWMQMAMDYNPRAPRRTR